MVPPEKAEALKQMIYSALSETGESYTVLATAVGTTPEEIQDWMSGQTEPSVLQGLRLMSLAGRIPKDPGRS